MDDVAFHPTEQARRERARRARAAAEMAGRRANWPVPEGLLSRIEADTSRLRLAPGQIEAIAAGIVEEVRKDANAPAAWQTTDARASGYFQIVFGRVVLNIAGMSPAMLMREDDSSSGYSVMANPDLTGTPEMTSVLGRADRCGMGWMRHSRELLQMGPAALQALIDARFHRESFERLREAGFDRREAARVAVGISRYATRHGLDANEIARETADGVNSFGAGSPEERRRWIERFERFYQNPDDEAARADMSRALTEMETRGTPEQRERVQRLRPLLRLDQEARAELSAATLEAGTETAEARADREARERAAREAREREAAERAAREAERARAEESARQEAAERARLAALLGEAPPADAPAPAAQEGPAPPVQRAEVRPPRLTAAPT